MNRLRIRVYEGGELRFDGEAGCPLEIGRQRTGEPEPFSLAEAGGMPRLVVARHKAENISRTHVRLTVLADGRVRVTNLSRLHLRCGPDGELLPGRHLDAPRAEVLVGPCRITAVLADRPDEATPTSSATVDHLQGLSGLTPAPTPGARCRVGPLGFLTSEQVDGVADWLQPVLGALESAVGSADFQAAALRAMVEVVGLSSGRIYVPDGTNWRATAGHFTDDTDEGRSASRTILNRVRNEARTFWEAAEQYRDSSASLRMVGAVVAAPLLDRDCKVIGVLYGERKLYGPSCRPVNKLDAVLVEMLAGGISAGLARQQREAEATTARVQLSQFFTADLAAQLAAEPALLAGRDAEVTVLFCDIRGFSRVSEKLGPTETVNWIRSVMSTLSECVWEENGTVVDYVGDELIAMWGAPRPQADQAERATRAALAMLRRLQERDADWHALIGESVRVGVGINTGVARVGNIGSELKFKYGPLGNTVNLASRVQGATKYLQCDLLVTGETRRRLGDGFLARRVSRVRVANILEPVDLYEVESAGDPDRAEFFRLSQAALEMIEAGDPLLAVHYLASLLVSQRDDGPLLLLLSRATERLVRDQGAGDPVWTLPGK